MDYDKRFAAMIITLSNLEHKMGSLARYAQYNYFAFKYCTKSVTKINEY